MVVIGILESRKLYDLAEIQIFGNINFYYWVKEDYLAEIQIFGNIQFYILCLKFLDFV